MSDEPKPNVRGMSDAELEDYALNVMARDDYDPKVLEVIDCDGHSYPDAVRSLTQAVRDGARAVAKAERERDEARAVVARVRAFAEMIGRDMVGSAYGGGKRAVAVHVLRLIDGDERPAPMFHTPGFDTEDQS